MATTLTATYDASLELALYETPPIPPTGMDFTDITFETGGDIDTHTSGTFKRVANTAAGKMLEFELADTGTGKTWVKAIYAENLTHWKIDASA
jgi:hypothetical protein